jgi:tape measure domain-containing protein
MANNETVLKIKAQIDGLQGLEKLKSSMKRISAEVDGAENNFSELLQKLKQLQASSVKSINNLNAQRDAFEQLRRSVDLNSKEFKEARDEIEKIDRALKQSQGTVGRFAANSIKSLRTQKEAFLAVRDSADLMSKEFKEAGVELAKLDKKLAKAEGKGRGGGARLRGAAQIAGTVAGAGVFGGPEGAIGALGGGLVGGVGGAVLGGALGAQVGQLRKAAGGVAEYVAELNLAKGALGGVSKDIVEYNQNLDFAREISKKYAIRLTDVIKGYTGVTAAAKANNLTVKQTQAIYEGITVSGVAAGKSQEDLQALFLATTQVLSKGKASAEEISGQIGERIPGAVAKFAAANKISLQELAEQFKKGEVTIAKFVRFTEQQGEDYAEVAEALASGPEKAGVRLQIALDEASEAFGGFFLQTGAGFQDYLTNLVDFVIDNEKQFKILLAKVIIFAEDVYDTFAGLGKAIWQIFGGLFKGIGKLIIEFSRATSAMFRQQDLEGLVREKGLKPNDIRRQAFNQIQQESGDLFAPYKDRGALNDLYNKLLADAAGVDRTNEENRLAEVLKGFGEYTPPAFAKPGQTAPPSADLDGGGDGKGDKSSKADERRIGSAILGIEKLMSKLKSMNVGLTLSAKKVGATAEQEIKIKYEQSLQKAIDVTEGLNNQLIKYEDTIGRTVPEVREELNKLRMAYVDLADAERAAALQQLADKRFGEKLKGYGFTGEALDAGGKIFAPGALDQQALLKESIKEMKKGLEELVNPVNQIVGAANAIGDSFAQSFKSVINGSATAQQALASFFQNIGSYFLDMAAKILAEMIKISILNAVTGLLPGLGSSAGSGFNLGGFGSLSPDAASGTSGFLAGVNFSGRANGGPVSANTPYIVGERGRELFIPRQSGSITNNDQFEAARKAMGGAKNSSNDAFAENAEAIGVSTSYTKERVMERERIASINSNPIDVRTETTVINNVEYVTAKQFAQGMQSTARDAQARVLSDLRNRPATRAQVGIR